MRGHRRRPVVACLLVLLATLCGSGTSGAEGTTNGTITMWVRDSDASSVTMIPCIIIFLLLQRYYVKGMTAGAVK